MNFADFSVNYQPILMKIYTLLFSDAAMFWWIFQKLDHILEVGPFDM